MKIQPIKTYITPKSTGWASAIALGCTAISGFSKNKSIRKLHKPFAVLTGIFTISHIAILEYYKNNFKH